MRLKNVLVFLSCSLSFALWSDVAESCIVSGSTVRDAVHSGVSDSVTLLDAAGAVTAFSSGGNVNAYPFGTVLIVR